ncbi:hypothetical protein DFJ74DRAFT_681717 [Hyaloraphidium curvatum]|nr:hypothetical protein DFJ74DRAFT_681717 [Hyaloraphidium curvatum]
MSLAAFEHFVHLVARATNPESDPGRPPLQPCSYTGKPCAYGTNPCNGVIANCNNINSTQVWVGIIVIVALSAIVIAVPKYPAPFGGPNIGTTKTSLVLTFVCCYLIFCFTYLAQWFPLVYPERSAEGGEH